MSCKILVVTLFECLVLTCESCDERKEALFTDIHIYNGIMFFNNDEIFDGRCNTTMDMISIIKTNISYNVVYYLLKLSFIISPSTLKVLYALWFCYLFSSTLNGPYYVCVCFVYLSLDRYIYEIPNIITRLESSLSVFS